MPRTKQFDIDDALDRAKDLLWQRGYDATSMEDLLQHMGINRGSFYDTFKSKREVLLAALARYDAVNRRAAIQGVAEGKNPRKAIMAVFRSITNPSRCPQGRYGCFMVNSALELAPGDKDVAKATDTCFREIAEFFASLVRMGQERKEIGPARSARETGRVLMNQLLGLMVLVRSGAPRSTIDSVIKQVEGLLQ